MLKAGDLARHRITIQSPSFEQDSNGHNIQTWVDFAVDEPAAIKPISVNTFIAGQSQQSKILGRIVVRYRPGLEATQRAVEGSNVYDLHGWLPDQDAGLEYYTAPYSAGVNDGGF